MENEIMNNTEVMETAEEAVVETASGMGTGAKVAAGAGLAILVGVVAYKYALKPGFAKIKTRFGKKYVDKAETVEPDEVIEAPEIIDG